MASVTTDLSAAHKPVLARMLHGIDRAFASISAAVRMSAEAKEIYSLSDRELAERGLDRAHLDRYLLQRFQAHWGR